MPMPVSSKEPPKNVAQVRWPVASNFTANASVPPAMPPAPGAKLKDAVSPVTYALPAPSTAIAFGNSSADPPR